MIVILAGVAGSGKSTVGRIVAAQMGWTFEDSDLLHSTADIAKMMSGVPLTDADRWPWLRTVASWIDQQIAAGKAGVVACSALKRSYREFLHRAGPTCGSCSSRWTRPRCRPGWRAAMATSSP